MGEDSVFKIQSTIRFSGHQNDINQHWFLPWLVVTLESHLQIKHGWISHNQVMSTGCILSAYQTTISYQNIFMFYMKLNLKNWLTLSTFLRFISMLLTEGQCYYKLIFKIASATHAGHQLGAYINGQEYTTKRNYQGHSVKTYSAMPL